MTLWTVKARRRRRRTQLQHSDALLSPIIISEKKGEKRGEGKGGRKRKGRRGVRGPEDRSQFNVKMTVLPENRSKPICGICILKDMKGRETIHVEIWKRPQLPVCVFLTQTFKKRGNQLRKKEKS